MNNHNFGEYVFGEPYFGWLLRGIQMTIVIALLSGILASLLGFGVLQLQLSRWKAIRGLGILYVLVFRNLPVLPLLLFLTYAVPGVWLKLTGHPFPRGFEMSFLLLGLSLNTGAYLAEILKAGVQAIPAPQTDAARTLGLSDKTVRRKIWYPQALRIVAPALASRIIHNTKNSTMALIVALPLDSMEVMGQASRITAQTFIWVEPLLFVAAVHLILALGLGRLLNRWAVIQQARVEGRA